MSFHCFPALTRSQTVVVKTSKELDYELSSTMQRIGDIHLEDESSRKDSADEDGVSLEDSVVKGRRKLVHISDSLPALFSRQHTPAILDSQMLSLSQHSRP